MTQNHNKQYNSVRKAKIGKLLFKKNFEMQHDLRYPVQMKKQKHQHHASCMEENIRAEIIAYGDRIDLDFKRLQPSPCSLWEMTIINTVTSCLVFRTETMVPDRSLHSSHSQTYKINSLMQSSKGLWCEKSLHQISYYAFWAFPKIYVTFLSQSSLTWVNQSRGMITLLSYD